MVDLSSVFSSVHTGLQWFRDTTTKAIPFNNDIFLLTVAFLVVFILKGRRPLSGISLLLLTIAVFLLLRLA